VSERLARSLGVCCEGSIEVELMKWGDVEGGSRRRGMPCLRSNQAERSTEA